MKDQVQNLLKKFSYRAEWSEEDGVFIARALEMPSIKAHAEEPEDAIKEVKIPLAMALEEMLEGGEELPEPLATHKYKGRILIRTTPERHKELTIQAAEAGVPLNQFINLKIG